VEEGKRLAARENLFASCKARIGAGACLAGWHRSDVPSGAIYATNAVRALVRRVTASSANPTRRRD
jgi:hypothetical protein